MGTGFLYTTGFIVPGNCQPQGISRQHFSVLITEQIIFRLAAMKDLINCTYGYDEIMIASNIRTDEQIGQFIMENELHDDVNSIPESSQYLLDKAKLGALYRESFNCTLTDGYAVFASDYKPPEIYDGKQLPDSVNYSFNCCGGLRDVNKVFGMADQFSFFKDIYGWDITVSFDFFTHATLRNGRVVSP